MPRTCLFAFAAVLVLGGGAAHAASAQTGYSGQGYGRQGGYAQPQPEAPASSGDDGGYDDDRASARGLASGRSDADGYGGEQAPDLGRDLGLRPDQRAALQAYQQATTPSEAEQRQMQADDQRVAAMTTPQRLDFAAAQMRRDEADFARKADAVRRFYAQLTPQQQRRFDQLTGPQAGEDGPVGAADGRESPAARPR